MTPLGSRHTANKVLLIRGSQEQDELTIQLGLTPILYMLGDAAPGPKLGLKVKNKLDGSIGNHWGLGNQFCQHELSSQGKDCEARRTGGR